MRWYVARRIENGDNHLVELMEQNNDHLQHIESPHV